MNNNEALTLVTGLIQEYVTSVQSTNPAIASALAFAANAAVTQLTGVVHHYQNVLNAQNQSSNEEINKENEQ